MWRQPPITASLPLVDWCPGPPGGLCLLVKPIRGIYLTSSREIKAFVCIGSKPPMTWMPLAWSLLLYCTPLNWLILRNSCYKNQTPGVSFQTQWIQCPGIWVLFFFLSSSALIAAFLEDVSRTGITFSFKDNNLNKFCKKSNFMVLTIYHRTYLLFLLWQIFLADVFPRGSDLFIATVGSDTRDSENWQSRVAVQSTNTERPAVNM